jgi:hypothetical protein
MTEAVQLRTLRKALDKDIRPVFVKSYTETSYKAGIYDAAAKYWKEGSRGNFITRMNALVKFGLNDAWVMGAKDVGVDPDEFEQADKDQIAAIIATEKGYVEGLLDFIDSIANNPERTLESTYYRLDMWALRFPDVVDQARLWLGKKSRLVWELGPTHEHCQTGDRPGGVGCAQLAGIVAFGYEWETAGIAPKSGLLSCGGLNCACRLSPTTKRRSPRALQRLLDIMTGARL